jgi:ABC-type molybdenum transport system ATPase subunit/photorepair protein PhrA
VRARVHPHLDEEDPVRLTDAHLTNYRSVEDSGGFTVEQDVTCLVGKNESGKTAVLQALYRANPVEPSATFDEVIDFPARLTRQRKRWKRDEQVPVVKLTFQLDDSEVAAIEQDLGSGALASREFTVVRGYRDVDRVFGLQVEQTAIVTHLRRQLDITLGGPHRPVGDATTISEFYDALKGVPEPAGSVTKMLMRIESWPERDVELHIIDEYLAPRMPKFLYFDDYDSMPGKVSIPDLILRRNTGAVTRGERALLSLLNMAGVTLEDFQSTDQHERLIRELENAGNVISDEVFEYWSQSDQLEVKLEVLPVEAGAQPPFDQGPILQVRVHNKRHRASVPFAERSRGFVWFFSFLAYFNELEDTEDALILLLDEPGLSLHGRAQHDLLKLVDKRLAPRHQVVYTTHSPFMVDPDHLHRVRTVIDQDQIGTKVSAEIFKADEDTAFPVLTAMGIEMTQTLFIGEHTLLLEGPSDLIFLDVLTDLVESRGGTGLDPRWVKTPIGGSGKLSTFVTLLGANKLHVAVLADSSTKDVGAVRRLRDNGQLATNGLVEIGEFTGTPDADIEDLFERDFYLQLVNLAYAKDLTMPITAADLNPNDPRIVRQVEGYFRQHGIAGGRFNHYKPAAALLREQTTVAARISTATLTRAERLFGRLNSLLP